MRLSHLADYAVVLMTAAARRPVSARLSATELACETGVPLPTTRFRRKDQRMPPAYTQATRPLRVTTALGPDALLVNSLSGRESLSQLIFIALHSTKLGQFLEHTTFFVVGKDVLELTLCVAETLHFRRDSRGRQVQ